MLACSSDYQQDGSALVGWLQSPWKGREQLLTLIGSFVAIRCKMAAVNKTLPKPKTGSGKTPPAPAPKKAQPKAKVTPSPKEGPKPKPKPKCQKSSASGIPNKAYQRVWKGWSLYSGFELDKRPLPNLPQRDVVTARVPENGCVLLNFLALARDPATIDWVASLLQPGKLQFPIPHLEAHGLIERFCSKEGVTVTLFESSEGLNGFLKLNKLQQFGKDQPRQCWMLQVPTIMKVDGAVELGAHLLPIIKFAAGAKVDADALFGDELAKGPEKEEEAAEEQKEGEQETTNLPPLSTSKTDEMAPPLSEPAEAPVKVDQVPAAQPDLSAEGSVEDQPQPQGESMNQVKLDSEEDQVAEHKVVSEHHPETFTCLEVDDREEPWFRDFWAPPQEADNWEEVLIAQYDLLDLQLVEELRHLREIWWSPPIIANVDRFCWRMMQGPRPEVAEERAGNRKQADKYTAGDLGIDVLFKPRVQPGFIEPPVYEGPMTTDHSFPLFPPRPIYDGAWHPGCDVRWRSGWFAAEKPATVYRWAKLFTAPELASATLAQASKWRTQCAYVPRTGDRGSVLAAGTIVSRDQMGEEFEEGDVLTMHKRRYVVRAKWWTMSNGNGVVAKKLLHLEMADYSFEAGCTALISDTAAALSPFARADPSARVERQLSKPPTGQLEMKLGYSQLLSRAGDAAQPMAVVARTDAAMHKWEEPAMQPYLVERYISRVMTASDERGWGYGGGKGYNWGYCYSCGKNPPGQFPGRLCKGGCAGCTKAARMATYGYQVVKPGGCVYPGVVQNVGQFPPIKSSVETIATAETLKGVPLTKEALRALPMEQQPAARLGGIGFGGVYPFSFAKGAGVLGAGLAYRAFRAVDITVDERVFEHASQNMWLLAPGFSLPKEPWSKMQWLQSMPTRRRKPLLRAMKAREERGEPHRHYARFNPIVKDEHALYGGVVDGMVTAEAVEAVPRIIFAPHEETHLDAGRYLKPLVPELKKVWHVDNWLFYASAKPEVLDAWVNRINGAESYFCADYSAFERSHSPASWKFMEGMYRQIYPGAEPEFWQALEAWRKPSGVKKMPKFDARVEFKCQCMNASGRDDTSLSNAMLNGVGLALSFAAALAGKDILEVGVEDIRRASELCDIAVMGDDSMVACRFDIEQYREQILSNLRRFGFVVKAVTTPFLHDVTFLGMMPYPVAGKLYWGPTIGRRMFKAFWQHDPKGNLPAWTHGTAQQLALNACVPIVADCAEQVKRILQGKKATKVEAVTEGYGSAWTLRTAATPSYDESTLRWLEARYPGLTADAIRRDVRRIRAVERLPALIRLETTDMAFACDDM